MSKLSRAQQTIDDGNGFLADVLHGLRRRPRTIPPKYFYDAAGSRLFDLICTTPEYYPTRAETGILERHGAAMVELIGTSSMLIELGSGSATKTPLLLQHLDRDAVYVPIDICAPHLHQSTQRLQQRFPAIPMRPLCADYMDLSLPLPAARNDQRRVIYFPGSTIGNCTPEDATELLRHLARLAGSDGALLIGVDCKKAPERLNAAYNDADGYTAAFNLNLLERMRRELDAVIDPQGFAHHAVYNPARGRVEMHLISRRRQHIELAGETFFFDEGESIHTENSYKYSPDEFRHLADQAGWQAYKLWTDEDGLFSVHYLRVRDA